MLHFAAKKLIENSPNMVLILDDNSEIGAHEWSDLYVRSESSKGNRLVSDSLPSVLNWFIYYVCTIVL